MSLVLIELGKLSVEAFPHAKKVFAACLVRHDDGSIDILPPWAGFRRQFRTMTPS